MTEIEQLIKQAKETLKRPKQRDDWHPVSNLSWQELLDGKDYPHLRYGKL